MKEFAKDVQRERTRRIHFQVARERKKEFSKLSTLMYASPLEKISTQNGIPKEINKIIVKIIK